MEEQPAYEWKTPEEAQIWYRNEVAESYDRAMFREKESHKREMEQIATDHAMRLSDIVENYDGVLLRGLESARILGLLDADGRPPWASDYKGPAGEIKKIERPVSPYP